MTSDALRLWNETKRFRRGRRAWREAVAEVLDAHPDTDELVRLADLAVTCVDHARYRHLAEDDAQFRRWCAFAIVDGEYLRATGEYPDC